MNNQNHNNLNIPPNEENNENNLNLDNEGEDHRRQYSGTVLLRLDRRTQPFCTITLKNTKEVAGFNELAEAMLKLDMVQAVKDIRLDCEHNNVKYLAHELSFTLYLFKQLISKYQHPYWYLRSTDKLD